MKIAVFSDIHANLAALEAVIEDINSWQPDQVIMAGDLVNRGPRPAECLALFQEWQRTNGWLAIRGNHEDYVIKQSEEAGQDFGPAFEVHRASYWTYTRLGRNVSVLKGMPFQVSLPGPDGREIRFVHASMVHNRDGIYPETNSRELKIKIGLPDQTNNGTGPSLFAVGHTHRPLIRRLNGTLVVNAGSAGLPFDGDPRPSYARIWWEDYTWQARIIRVEYDHLRAQQDFFDSGYMDQAGPLTRLVLIELKEAHSMLFGWAWRYQAKALAGEITMEESVNQYLAEGQF